MKINPTDWVLYRINPLQNKNFLGGRVEIKFEEFSKIPNYLHDRLQQLASRYVYTEIPSYSEKWGTIDILLIADENASKYVEKFKTSFKAPNSSYYGLRSILDPRYHPTVSKALMSLYGLLNHPEYESGTKKAIATDIVKKLSEDKLSNEEVHERWLTLYRETKEKINQLKKFMENINKQKFLVELSPYDKEAKKKGDS